MTLPSPFRRALLLAVGLGAATAWAQGYPAKPVTLVVPFPPGGVTDASARAVSKRLGEMLGQQFIIDNRAGAGGSIGSEMVARAAPDGYTLLWGTSGTLAGNPFLYKGLRYDPLVDFVPVHGIMASPPVLFIESGRPWKTVADLVRAAKSQPGKLNYGSGGVGTGTHLVSELFQDVAGVKFAHVAYKGSAPALQDVLGGRIELMFDYMPTILPHVRSGKLRPLAVMANRRLDALPDVPTITELGYPGAELSPWAGMVAPAGTPPEVVRKLSMAIETLLSDKAFTAQFTDVGSQLLVGMKESEFRRFIVEEQNKWSDVIRKSGATLN